jgi:hypothetical protein
MGGLFGRVAVAAAAATTPLAFVLLISPAVGHAAECGVGTVYDAPSNSCVAAAPALPPPPAPAGDLTPGFSVSICAPIPFVAICTGV